MIYKIGGKKAAVVSATAVRQGVTGHNVRYVLGISILGVILAFGALAFYLGGRLPL